MENEHFTPGANQPLMSQHEKNAKLLEENREFADGAVYKPTVSMEDVVIKQPPKYVGLTKEELQKYADDPFWKKLRWFFLILFWLAWIAMFVAAIIIVALSPKCPPKPNLKWWQKKVCYQIWTKSFQDSDGDGVGDLNGLNQRVKQLAGLKIQSIWPVPLLKSSSGNGYDVENFTEIDKRYGTMENFEALIAETHKNSLKFIMDIPMSTVSAQHEWFANDDKKDFFYWRDSASNRPGGYIQWVQKHEKSGKFYLHMKNRSDYVILNWSNPEVRAEMKNVFKFWLDKGVDGFYFGKIELMAINDDGLTDWDQVHDYINETVSYIRDAAGDADGEKILLFTSISDLKVEDSDGVHLDGVMKGDLNFVISSHLVNVDEKCGTECLYDTVAKVHSFHKDNVNITWPMWEIGQPYVSRVATRMGGRERAELLMMMLLVLPGSVNTYYGDEIGMTDVDSTNATGNSRYRGAMQWNKGKNAGFSSADKLGDGIFLNPDYETRNLDTQLNRVDDQTTAKMYKRLTGLRYSDEAFLFGDFDLGARDSTLLTAYRRSKFNTADYLVVLNFGGNQTEIPYNVSGHFAGAADKDVQALVMTSNLAARKIYSERQSADLTNLRLKGNEGIVLRLKVKK